MGRPRNRPDCLPGSAFTFTPPGAAHRRLPEMDRTRGSARVGVDSRVHRFIRTRLRSRYDPTPIRGRCAEGARGELGSPGRRPGGAGGRRPVGEPGARAAQAAGPLNDRIHGPDRRTGRRRARGVWAGALARLAGRAARCPSDASRRRRRGNLGWPLFSPRTSCPVGDLSSWPIASPTALAPRSTGVARGRLGSRSRARRARLEAPGSARLLRLRQRRPVGRLPRLRQRTADRGDSHGLPGRISGCSSSNTRRSWRGRGGSDRGAGGVRRTGRTSCRCRTALPRRLLGAGGVPQRRCLGRQAPLTPSAPHGPVAPRNRHSVMRVRPGSSASRVRARSASRRSES
jgi:hypothetical protein